MPTQTLPQSAREYARSQRRETEAALAAVGRQWRRMGPNFDASYALIEPTLLAILDRAQERSTVAASRFVPDVLTETRQSAARATPRYSLRSTSLVGTAGDGLPTDSLAYQSVIHAKTAIGEGLTVPQALVRGGQFLTLATGTLLSDTRRTAELVATNARSVTGWVRGLNPPSCGRCVILAGRREHSSEPFLRHPGCDCISIPAAESIADDLMVDPQAYLDHLDDDALARTLGSQANAQAYRDGADVNQLVNAYRRKGDVRAAQVYGRHVRYTTEGTTRRGRAYRSMRQARYAQDEVRRSGERYFRLRAPRLMPQSIYQIATDPADAQRLLRLYGWIL